jgi:DNA-binding SARP family transcriptional activator/Tfp pilus assembly protein PilF
VLQTTRSGEILASLAKRGLFVSRRSDDAYSYHQLFRESLRHSLERSRQPQEVAALHRRVADVLVERGDVAGAIAHALDAGDAEHAAAMLEESGPSLLRVGLVSAVGALLPRIDAARIQRSPALLMALGRVQRERGEWDAALATLERGILAARVAGAYDVLADSVRYCASVLASRGEFERLRGMLDDALALGTLLSDESVTTLRMTLAAVYIEIDRFEDALAIFREITPSVIARGDYASQGSVLHNTAVAHLRRGDLYAGLAMYERALKLKRSSGQRVSSLLTLGDLVYTRTLLGDLDEADRLCEDLLHEAYDIGNNALVAHAHENLGVLRLARGDFEGAAKAFGEALRACDPGDVLVLPDIQHGLARCSLQRGEISEADELCSVAIGIFRGAGKQQQLAPILLTRAEVLAKRGDLLAARAVASDAIESANKGADAVLQAMTCLDTAAFLVRLAQQLPRNEAASADLRAAEAATTAVALLHQRDYRFLLRTRAAAFAELRDHLRRWNVGLSLVPEIPGDRAASGLQVEMLGGLRVSVDGQPLAPEAWKRRKARDIFAYLVSLHGRSVTRARLADLYWPEADADAAHDNLRVTISAIRKAVGDVVRFEANGYRFAAPPETVVDIERFDDHIEAGRQAVARGDSAEARRRYRAAADLYSGEFLDGMEEGGWQWHERERLRAACLEGLRWLASDREDPKASRLALERLLEVAPFDLDAVRMRLDALVREMRLGEARRHYDDWRARYRAAVGADPPDVWDPEPAPA